MKTFWYNLFQSYQLTPKNCHRLTHLMLAIFAPITYPAFEVLNLIKYTRRKLQLNEFLENDKDLDLELPFSKQPRRLQNRVIDYFDCFTSYKNARTKKSFLIHVG